MPPIGSPIFCFRISSTGFHFSCCLPLPSWATRTMAKCERRVPRGKESIFQTYLRKIDSRILQFHGRSVAR
jgi:hypothetical protein